MNHIPVVTVSLPGYKVDKEPDHKALGKIVDDEIKKHFLGQSILVRGVASSEHRGKTVDEVIDIIQRTGTDRYDSSKVGDRYENVERRHIDLFAFPHEVTKKSKIFADVVWGFYHSAIGIHGRPMRIDILTIYDASQLEEVAHRYKGRADIKRDGFVFKNPDNKKLDLKAIFKIL